MRRESLIIARIDFYFFLSLVTRNKASSTRTKAVKKKTTKMKTRRAEARRKNAPKLDTSDSKAADNYELKTNANVPCCERNCYHKYNVHLDSLQDSCIDLRGVKSVEDLVHAIESSENYSMRQTHGEEQDDAVGKAYHFQYTLDFGRYNLNHPVESATNVCPRFFLYALNIEPKLWHKAVRRLAKREARGRSDSLFESAMTQALKQSFMGEVAKLANCDLATEIAHYVTASAKARTLLRLVPAKCKLFKYSELERERVACTLYGVYAEKFTDAIRWKAVRPSGAAEAPQDAVGDGGGDDDGGKASTFTAKLTRCALALFGVSDGFWQYARDAKNTARKGDAMALLPEAQAPIALRASLRCAHKKSEREAVMNFKREQRAAMQRGLECPPSALVPSVNEPWCTVCAFAQRSAARYSKWPAHFLKSHVPNFALVADHREHVALHMAGAYAAERFLEAEILLRKYAPACTESVSVFPVDGGALDVGVCNVFLPQSMSGVHEQRTNVNESSAALFVCYDSFGKENNSAVLLPLENGVNEYEQRALFLACEALETHADDVVRNAAACAAMAKQHNERLGDTRSIVLNVVFSVRHAPMGAQFTRAFQSYFQLCVNRCVERTRLALEVGASGVVAIVQAVCTQVPLVHCASSFAPALVEEELRSKWLRGSDCLVYSDFKELSNALASRLPVFDCVLPYDEAVDPAFSEEKAREATAEDVRIQLMDDKKPAGVVRAIGFTLRLKHEDQVREYLTVSRLPFTALDEPALVVDTHHTALECFVNSWKFIVPMLALDAAVERDSSTVFVQSTLSNGAAVCGMTESEYARHLNLKPNTPYVVSAFNFACRSQGAAAFQPLAKQIKAAEAKSRRRSDVAPATRMKWHHASKEKQSAARALYKERVRAPLVSRETRCFNPTW